MPRKSANKIKAIKRFTTDRAYRLGVIVRGRYVLLDKGHEVAIGLDRHELDKISDMLNSVSVDQERHAIRYAARNLK